MRRHTGERPYMCEVCAASYPQKCQLQAHMRSAHSTPLEDGSHAADDTVATKKDGVKKVRPRTCFGPPAKRGRALKRDAKLNQASGSARFMEKISASKRSWTLADRDDSDPETESDPDSCPENLVYPDAAWKYFP